MTLAVKVSTAGLNQNSSLRARQREAEQPEEAANIELKGAEDLVRRGLQ